MRSFKKKAGAGQQRNYFRKDQESKARVEQMRRTMTDSNASLPGVVAKQESHNNDKDNNNDVSQHD